jgi:hypothetical protein
LSAVAPIQPDNLIRDLKIAIRTCLRTPYEGSLALPYKDPVQDLLFLVPGSSSQHCLFARPCSQARPVTKVTRREKNPPKRILDS